MTRVDSDIGGYIYAESLGAPISIPDVPWTLYRGHPILHSYSSAPLQSALPVALGPAISYMTNATVAYVPSYCWYIGPPDSPSETQILAPTPLPPISMHSSVNESLSDSISPVRLPWTRPCLLSIVSLHGGELKLCGEIARGRQPLVP